MENCFFSVRFRFQVMEPVIKDRQTDGRTDR